MCATIVAFAAVLYFAYLIQDTIKLVFISIFLAIALGPVVDFFQFRRMPRSLAILLSYLAFTAMIAGVALLVVPPVVQQVDELAQDLPTYIQDVRDNSTFRELDDKYSITDKLVEQAEELPATLGDAAGTLQAVTFGAFSAAIQLITVITLTFLFLLQGRRLLESAYGFMGEEKAERYRTVANDIYGSVAGYVMGKLLMSLIAGIITYVTLLILGVPFAAPLAVLMGFLSLIPMVGATIAAVFIALITLFHDFPTATIIWIIVAVVYQQLENNLLQPVIFRKTTDVQPIIVIVAILIGSALLGVLGALVAIPVAAAVQIIIRDWWKYRQYDRGLTGPPHIGSTSEAPASEPA